MSKEFAVSIFLCEECEKKNQLLDFIVSIPQGTRCTVCGEMSYRAFSAEVWGEEEVAEILKDFYKHEDIAERALLNKAKKDLYGEGNY